MKRRSVLFLYLEKIAGGDESCIDNLCKRLADRLIHVPIVTETASKTNTKTKSKAKSKSKSKSKTKAKSKAKVKEEPQKNEDPRLKRINVVCVKYNRKKFVPIFTSEELLKSWCKKKKLKVDSISLLGADLCMALANTKSIWIDPTSKHSVKLKPDDVQKISNIVLEEAEAKVA